MEELRCPNCNAAFTTNGQLDLGKLTGGPGSPPRIYCLKCKHEVSDVWVSASRGGQSSSGEPSATGPQVTPDVVLQMVRPFLKTCEAMVSSGKGSDPAVPDLIKAWESLLRVAQALKPKDEALRELRMPANPTWADALAAGQVIEGAYSGAIPMARFCTNCGGPLPDNANHCPGCGKPVHSGGGGAAAAPWQSASGGLADNVAGVLTYLFIPAIIFLFVEPYARNRFIRFHAFQSLIFFVVVIIVSVVMPFIAVIPILGVLIWALVCLAEFILWVLLLIKAYNGELWKLPVVGDIAEKQANA